MAESRAQLESHHASTEEYPRVVGGIGGGGTAYGRMGEHGKEAKRAFYGRPAPTAERSPAVSMTLLNDAARLEME